jgi:hypothetical protein
MLRKDSKKYDPYSLMEEKKGESRENLYLLKET